MKKIFAAFAALALTGQMAIGQAVSDLEIIPVSVTVNTVLRINVERGGNIEFVFNTIEDYKNGFSMATSLSPNSRWQTEFMVAASRDFNVDMVIDDAAFIGVDNAANSLPLDNVGYTITALGDAAANTINSGAAEALVTADFQIITGVAASSAGDGSDNRWTIDWECGTTNGTMNPLTMLEQSVEQDRYTSNVYLELVAQ